MNSCPPYIVILEVDNVRAAAAYRKAKAELEILFSECYEEFKERDQVHSLQSNAKFKADHATTMARLDAGIQDNWLGPPAFYSRNLYGLPNYYSEQLERARFEIAHHLSVADLAVAPYRVPEEQAILIADCESGEWIRRLRDRRAHAWMPKEIK